MCVPRNRRDEEEWKQRLQILQSKGVKRFTFENGAKDENRRLLCVFLSPPASKTVMCIKETIAKLYRIETNYPQISFFCQVAIGASYPSLFPINLLANITSFTTVLTVRAQELVRCFTGYFSRICIGVTALHSVERSQMGKCRLAGIGSDLVHKVHRS